MPIKKKTKGQKGKSAKSTNKKTSKKKNKKKKEIEEKENKENLPAKIDSNIPIETREAELLNINKEMQKILESDDISEDDMKMIDKFSKTNFIQFQVMFLSYFKDKIGKSAKIENIKHHGLQVLFERLPMLDNEELITALNIMQNMSSKETDAIMSLFNGKSGGDNILNVFMQKIVNNGNSDEGRVFEVEGHEVKKQRDPTRAVRMLDTIAEIMDD